MFFEFFHKKTKNLNIFYNDRDASKMFPYADWNWKNLSTKPIDGI